MLSAYVSQKRRFGGDSTDISDEYIQVSCNIRHVMECSQRSGVGGLSKTYLGCRRMHFISSAFFAFPPHPLQCLLRGSINPGPPALN
jgi:hypothetical protein